MARRWILLVPTLASLFLVRGPVAANHHCGLAVGPAGGDPARPGENTIEATVGDEVVIYFYQFGAGEARLDWLVDGEPVPAKSRVVTIAATPGIEDPQSLGEQGFAVTVKLDPSDTGTVTVLPHQEAIDGGQTDCGDASYNTGEATIVVAADVMPATTTSAPRRDDSPGAIVWAIGFLALVALSAVSTRHARRGVTLHR